MSANAYQFITLSSALSLELNTGMKASRHWSTLTLAKQYGYTGKQRKLDALVWVCEVLLNNGLKVMPYVMETLNKNGYELLVDEEGEQFID